MTRSALLLGAGSQLTPFLSQRLVEQGFAGVCVSRTCPPELPAIAASFQWRRVDLADTPAWPPMPGTVVISLVPLWLLPPHLPALAASGIKQLVAFSSTSVFAKAGSPDPAERSLALKLAAAEKAVASVCEDMDVPWTILRPTLIYGSGRDQNVSAVARFIRHFGCFPVAYPADGLRQPVHAEDLAQAAVAAIDTPQAYSRAFDLPGGETLTYKAMIERIFDSMGRPPRLLPLPTSLLRAAMPLVRDRLPYRYSPALFLRMNQDLAFDGGPAYQVLGYTPRPFSPEGV